jgi:hypothetical protein
VLAAAAAVTEAAVEVAVEVVQEPWIPLAVEAVGQDIHTLPLRPLPSQALCEWLVCEVIIYFPHICTRDDIHFCA